jgi:hypothetical protein
VSQVRSVGFWSYTRRDDELEGGRILRLVSKIQNEYELCDPEYTVLPPFEDWELDLAM